MGATFTIFTLVLDTPFGRLILITMITPVSQSVSTFADPLSPWLPTGAVTISGYVRVLSLHLEQNVPYTATPLSEILHQ